MTATTTATDALAHRIRTITDIINRKSTPEGERAAARHMLAQLQAKADKLAEEAGVTTQEWGAGYRLPEGWYGAKYERGKHLSATEIAALIRADIKLARKLGERAAEPGALRYPDPIGDAPDFLKITVRKQSYSGGRSITVTIRGVPADWWVTEPAYWDETYPITKAGPRLAELGQALRELANAYNYDRSDIQVDYFDKNFYLHVEADGQGEFTREVDRPRRW